MVTAVDSIIGCYGDIVAVVMVKAVEVLWLLWWHRSAGVVVAMVTTSVIVMVTAVDGVVGCYSSHVCGCYGDTEVIVVVSMVVMVTRQWIVLLFTMLTTSVFVMVTAVDGVVGFYADSVAVVMVMAVDMLMVAMVTTVIDFVIGCYGDGVMLLRWYSSGWWWCRQQWILSVVFPPACVCVCVCVCVWACVAPRAAWWSR